MQRISFIIFILLSMTTALAQESTAEPEQTPEVGETCPVLVANALDFTKETCSATNTNEACYGYTFIDAELRSNEARFVEPGDIEDVINIQSVQLSPLDVLTGQWGVILLNVEPNANLTEEQIAPQQDLQIVLYGDAQLTDASQFIEVTATSSVNIRELPSTTSTVIGSLASDETVIANGRLDDNSWYRIRLSNAGDVSNGWIAAEFLAPQFDPETLPIITEEQAQDPQLDIAAQYGPMQALIFESGRDDAPCEQAPNSGMLIQTPEGVASVNILLDEVVIQLDGTGVISAQADGNLTVGVIEGTAQIEANGGISTAVAGQAVDVPLDSNLVPVGQPELPRPLTPDEVQALPTDLLDRPIDATLTTNEPLLSSATDGFAWQFGYNMLPPYICSDGTEVILDSAGIAPTVSLEADALVISGLRYPEVSEGVYAVTYSDSSGNLISDTVQIVATDRIVGDRTIDLFNPPCTLSVTFGIQLSAQ